MGFEDLPLNQRQSPATPIEELPHAVIIRKTKLLKFSTLHGLYLLYLYCKRFTLKSVVYFFISELDLLNTFEALFCVTIRILAFRNYPMLTWHTCSTDVIKWWNVVVLLRRLETKWLSNFDFPIKKIILSPIPTIAWIDKIYLPFPRAYCWRRSVMLMWVMPFFSCIRLSQWVTLPLPGPPRRNGINDLACLKKTNFIKYSQCDW